MNFDNHRSFLPYGNYNSNCDTCVNDPLYNPPQANCPPNFDSTKNPCPLKSFCDPGLANTCESKPVIYPFGPRRAVTTWKVIYLISTGTINQGVTVDDEMVNPWGLIIFNNELYVANGSSDSITNYDLFGNKNIDFPVNVRDDAHNSSYPTGLAINCTGGFPVTSGGITKSATLLSCSEHGTVHAYNPKVNTITGHIVLNQQLTGEVSVFKGLAIANSTLYLANFFQRVIDVFDSAYNRLLGFNFIDGDSIDPIPLDFSPHNIVHIGCFLYVLYARKDPNVTMDDLPGPGHGFISVFNLDGTWVKRFTSRGVLDTPWAMIPAPCEFGYPPGSFLVGNNGDGRINVFDCAGRYVGPMLGQSGLPIQLDGLWGLAANYTDFSQIFFVASPREVIDGLLGSLIKDQVIYF
jgi:uncharacterized protein (TIGR03118 family)